MFAFDVIESEFSPRFDVVRVHPVGLIMRGAARAVSPILILVLCSPARLHAQDTSRTFVTTTAVRLRKAPGLTTPITRVLSKGERVRLTADSSTAAFWPVRTARDEAGWVHGRYLAPPAPVVRVPITTSAASATSYPACGGEHHFRWSAKKSTAQENLPTTHGATVTGMLHWAPRLDLGKDLASWCAPRSGRELRKYRVTGWVRTIRKGEDDGDWHVEVTSTRTTPVTNCVVVEIPTASYAPEFGTARTDLTSLTSGSALDNNTGKLTPPVRLKFTGAAFDDGWHGPNGAMPSGHGQCNSTLGAVWEIHPIFKVGRP